MKYEILHLKDYFPALGENGCDATVTAYLADNLTEMGRDHALRPCLVICPGGGYQYCSQREAEPIALHFLPEGFHVFILNYSTEPHRYPTQLREAAGCMELRPHGIAMCPALRFSASPRAGIWRHITQQAMTARKFGLFFLTASRCRRRSSAIRSSRRTPCGRIWAVSMP